MKIKYFVHFRHQFWHSLEKILLMNFLKVKTSLFAFVSNFLKYFYRNLHVLVFDFGVFFRKTWYLSILVVVERNLGIALKKMIIDIFGGVRLHILHFLQTFYKI